MTSGPYRWSSRSRRFAGSSPETTASCTSTTSRAVAGATRRRPRPPARGHSRQACGLSLRRRSGRLLAQDQEREHGGFRSSLGSPRRRRAPLGARRSCSRSSRNQGCATSAASQSATRNSRRWTPVLGQLRRPTPPCGGAGGAETWLEPAVICEVRFLASSPRGLRDAGFVRFSRAKHGGNAVSSCTERRPCRRSSDRPQRAIMSPYRTSTPLIAYSHSLRTCLKPRR